MNKPVAVLISDVHYNITTLKLADAAMRLAIAKANELGIPLIVAGDLHDTKANLRGECISAMIETFKLCKDAPFVIIGNHDKINEKSKEHALNFLDAYSILVESVTKIETITLLPYYNDSNELRERLKNITKNSTLIMHQGITGSNSGEYIQDKSAITKDDVAGMRVISGHYHTRQTIALPNGGSWDYIGNPYSLGFGEANDPPKGFQILMDDGSLEFVPTNLRKHVIIEIDLTKGNLIVNPNFGNDLIWLKVTGTKEQLNNFKKPNIPNCRIELIPLETTTIVGTSKKSNNFDLLDSLIDSLTNTSIEAKNRLKSKWKDIV